MLNLSARLEGPSSGNSQLTAPEWAVSEEWIDSEPLRLRDLRGNVVLVDFWTYSCIDCFRTIPYLNQMISR